MRLNIIAWNIARKDPQLICDTWDEYANKEKAKELLKEIAKETPTARGMVIDFKTEKIIYELKYKEIKTY
ncbi:MAG: hypothetical protein WC069_05825 [Candidatus Shapirobacteria bacterium]